jgi:1-phosphofructokinase family hexose kinase
VESKASFLCISANPAIDKRVRADVFRVGAVNRVVDVTPEPGGKAAHVAMALLAMGEQPSWIGFAGGASGEELIAGLNAAGIQTQSVESRKPTRVNLAILDADGVVTEILEPGGPISPPELDLFGETCERSFSQIKNQAVAIFSGSLPLGAPQDFYAELIRSARQAGCRTFLDTSGAVLQLALEQKPDFVKPNREEAEHLTGEAVTGIRQARKAVAEFFSRGARSVALSLGKDGLLWCPGTNQRLYRARPPVIEARSTVGSGDATVAGFAHALARGLPPEEAARWAAACGAANCLAVSPGRIRIADVEEMMRKTTVEKLE